MEFHAVNRRELQALCKKHGIPANKSNLEMANLLTSLLKESEKLPSQESSVVVDSEEKNVEKRVKKVRFSPDNEIRVYEPSVYKVSRRRTRSVSSLDVDGDSVVRTRRSGEQKEDISVVQVKKRGRGSRKMDKEESEPNDERVMRQLRNRKIVSEETEGKNEGVVQVKKRGRVGRKMDNEEREPNDGIIMRQLRNRKIVSEESGGKDEEDKARQNKSRKRKNEKATKENTEEEVSELENVSSHPKRNVRKKGSEKAEEIGITRTVARTQAKAESKISVIEDKETQGISGRSLRQKFVSSLKELQSEVLTGDDAEVQKDVRRWSKRNVANMVDSQPSMIVESKQVVSRRMTRSRAPVTSSASLSDGKDVVQVKDLKRTQRRNASRGRSAIPKKVNVKNDGQDVKENRKQSDVEAASTEVPDKPSLLVEHLRRSRRKNTVSGPSVTIDEGVIGEAVIKPRHMTKQVSDKDQHATVEPVQINKRVSRLSSKVQNSATKEITGKRVKAWQSKQKVAEVMDKEVSVALDEFVVGPSVPNEVAEMKKKGVSTLSLVAEDSKTDQVLPDDEHSVEFTGMTNPAEKSCSNKNSGKELLKSSKKTRSSKVRSSGKRRNDLAADSCNINLDLEGHMASTQSKSMTASEETRDTKQTLCDEEALTKDTGITKAEALENKNCLSFSESKLIRISDKTSDFMSRSRTTRRNDHVHDSDMQLNMVCCSKTTSVLEGNTASTQFKSVADSEFESALAFPTENEIIASETNNTIVDDTENLVSAKTDDVARSTAKQNSAEAELRGLPSNSELNISSLTNQSDVEGETMNHLQSDKGLIESELSSCQVIIHELLSADEVLIGCTGMFTPAEKSCLNVNSCTELLKSSNNMASSEVISSKKRRNDAAHDSAMHLNVDNSSNINLDLEGNMASLESKSHTASEETRGTNQTKCDEEALTKDTVMTESEALGNKHCLSFTSEGELIKSSDKMSSFKSGPSRTRRNDSVHDSDTQLNIVCRSNTTSILEGNTASTSFKSLADSADEGALAFPRENEVIANETNNTIVDDSEILVSVDTDDVARSTGKQNSEEAELAGLQSNKKLSAAALANRSDFEGEAVNYSQSDKGLRENELSSCRVMIHEKDEPVDTTTKVDGSFTLDLEQSLHNAVSNEHENNERRSHLDRDSVHPLYMNILQDSMKETLVTPDRHTYFPLQNDGTALTLKEDGTDRQDNVLMQMESEVSSQPSIKRLHVGKKFNTEMAEDCNDYGASICMQSEKAIDLGCAMDVEFGDFTDSQMVATKEMTMSSPELLKEVLVELPDLVFQEKTVECSSEREFPGENGRGDAAVGSSESSETIFTRSISPESKCSMGSGAGSASTSDSLEATNTLSDKEIKSIMINFQHNSNSDTLVEDESAKVHTNSMKKTNTLSDEEIMSAMIDFQNSSNNDEQISVPLVDNENAQVHLGYISSGTEECSSHGEEFSNTNYTIPQVSSDASFRNCGKRSGATNTASEAQMSTDVMFSSADVNSELNVFSCHENDAILPEESKGFNEVDSTPSPTATVVQCMSNAQDMTTLQDVQGNLSDDQEAKLKEAGCYFEENDFMLSMPPGSIGFVVDSTQTKERSALPTFSSTAVTCNLFKEAAEDVEIKQIPSPKTSAVEECPALVSALIDSHRFAFSSVSDQGNNKEDVIENTANSGSKTGSLDKRVTLSAQVDVKEDQTISSSSASIEVLAMDNICKPDGLMNTSPLKESSGVLKSPALHKAPNHMALSPLYDNPEIASYSSIVQQQNAYASYEVEKSQAQESSNISSDAFKNDVICEGDFTDMSQQFQEKNKVEVGEHSLLKNYSGDAVQLFEIKSNAPDESVLQHETVSVVQSKDLVGLENFDFLSPGLENAAFWLELEREETRENAEVVEEHNENVPQSEQVISDKPDIKKGGEFEQGDDMTLQFTDVHQTTKPKCQIENAFGLELEKEETEGKAGEVAKEQNENVRQFDEMISEKPEFECGECKREDDTTLEFSDIQLSMKPKSPTDESIKSEDACVSMQKLTMIEGSMPNTFLDDVTISEWAMELDAINTDKEDKSTKLISKLDTPILGQSPAVTSSTIDQGIVAQEDCCNPEELLPSTEMTNSDVKEQDTNGSSYQPALPFAQFLVESNSHQYENSAVEWKKSRSVLILGTPKKTLHSKPSMSRTKMEGVGTMTAPKLSSKRQPLEDLTNNRSN